MSEELEKALETQNIINDLRKRISKFFPVDTEERATKDVIMMVHNLIEGIINLLLSRHYLGKEIERKDKDKVNQFWINVLVEINFEKKVKILKETEILSNSAIKILYKINNIRNDIAHYPHRQYKRKAEYLLYSGKHILKDIEALRTFHKDFDLIMDEARKHIKDDMANR